MKGSYSPYHYVEHYKYFRFFPNGVFLYFMSTKQMLEQQILKTLTLEKYKLSKTQKNQNSGFYLGEFIIRIKDRAALKKAVEESSDPNTSGTQHF